MDIIQCIKARRSIRKFTKEPVSHDVIRSIVEAASYSPSWKNTSICRYTVIENINVIKKIAEECTMGSDFNKSTISNSLQLVLVTMVRCRSGYERDGSFSTSKGDGWEMFDSGIATQTFCLAACEYGVGTVIMGIFDEEAIEKLFKIPEGQKISALIAIGYPDEEPAEKRIRTVDELISFVE